MHTRNKYLLFGGGGAIAIVAAFMMSSQTDQPLPQVLATDPVPNIVAHLEGVNKDDLTVNDTASEYNKPVPLFDENGVSKGYGERIRFSRVADCSETYVETLQGDWVPGKDCGLRTLQVDHPYGHYSIEQLEIAANDMDDADAAYILAERFTMENWRDRRGEAHKYYLKAFLLTTDGEIYDRMISEMGIFNGVLHKNGELDVAQLSAKYTMSRVGQKFGVVDDESVNQYAKVAKSSDQIDLNLLDQNADDIYKTLVAARGRMQ